MRRRILLLVSLALATSCRDSIVAPPHAKSDGSQPLRSTQVATTDLDSRITALADTVFPKGLGTAFTSRWTNIKRQLEKDPNGTLPGGKKGPAEAARKMYVELVQWVQDKTNSLTPPTGETQSHVVDRLVLDLSLYVYRGPSAQPPILTATTDAVLAIVQPNAAATIQTPSLHAGVAFAAGSVAEPTVVVITQETTPYPQNCTGPLNTRLCQYPQFYHFDVFPDVKLLQPARVVVCHVNAGGVRTPLADHDRLRLAHETPADPSAYMPGGTVVDGIEILPLIFAPTLVNCANDTYQTALGRRPSHGGPLGRLLDGALGLASAITERIGRAISPREAYAIDQGGGGPVLEFSAFANVDPLGQPDVRVQPGFSVSSSVVGAGTTVSVGPFTIQNAGTANIPGYTASLILANDAALTSASITLGTPVHHGALAAGASETQSAQTVTLPANASLGTRYIGVQIVVDGGSAPEANTTNNIASVSVTVGPALGSTLSCAAEGSVRSITGEVLSSIRFTNATSQTVRVFWLDYSGQRVLYNTLSAGASYVQGSYLTHPWILVGADESCYGIFLPDVTERSVTVGTTPPLTLISPVAGTQIVQNDPATGCAASNVAGFGNQINFAWQSVPGATQYRVLAMHAGALFPADDVTVAGTQYRAVHCDGYVIDPNLTNWSWQLKALVGGVWTPFSAPSPFEFLPCRHPNGEPCGTIYNYSGLASFSDSFEGSAINPFWTVTQVGGSISPSAAQAHTGSGAIAFASTAGDRGMTLEHRFSSPSTASFSVWFYDAAPGQETLYEQMTLSNSHVPGLIASIGTQDFDAFCYTARFDNGQGGSQGQNANCGIYPQLSTTSVPRTAGWHFLQVVSSQGAVAFSIDGQQLFSASGAYAFDTVRLSVSGPNWRPNTIAFFDDFHVQ